MITLLDPQSRQDFMIPVLGILPLLAVTVAFENAIAIGLIHLFVLVTVGLVVSVIRNLFPLEIRQACILLITTSIVSLVVLFLQLWSYETGRELGMYVPLLAVNCMVLAWAEEFALRHGVIKSFINTVVAGISILVILVIIATVREYSGLFLLKQPAGAFLVLASLIALCNFIVLRRVQTH